jgi:hypothetical protein
MFNQNLKFLVYNIRPDFSFFLQHFIEIILNYVPPKLIDHVSDSQKITCKLLLYISQNGPGCPEFYNKFLAKTIHVIT